MTITICGSMKFLDQMAEAKGKLEKMGHEVLMPSKEGFDLKSVDYWSENHKYRAEVKKSYNFIGEHLDKVEEADAVLVVNETKKEIPNYIGANTFLEMGYAHYRKKRVFVLNSLPDQPYIIDELLAINPVVLNGKLENIK